MRRGTKFFHDNLGYLISILILGMSWLPYLLSTYYVLPCSDDFGTANNMAALGGHSIRNVLQSVREVYLTWLGTWSGKAFSAFFDPVGRVGLGGNRVFLFFLSILFVLVVGGLFSVLFSLHGKIAGQRLCLLVSVCLAICLNCRILTQILFWFTGGAEYTLPVLLGFGGIICLVLSFGKVRKWRFLMPGTFLGWIACGGNLQVAGFICFVFLLVVCYSLCKKKNVKAYMISFVLTVSGALINVAAPGNYVRKDVIERDISLVRALFYAILAVAQELKYLFSSSWLPWLLLCLLVLDLFLLPVVQEKLYHPVLTGAAVILAWLVAVFPVCYGYGSSTLMDRGKELLDIYVVIGLCFWINSSANWLKKKNIIPDKGSFLVLFLLSLVNIGYQQSKTPFSEMPGAVCFLQLASGDLKEYHGEWEHVLKTIEESGEETVEVPVSRSVYEMKSIVRSPGLTEDPEDWHNVAIALFYGKESVRVVVEDAGESE